MKPIILALMLGVLTGGLVMVCRELKTTKAELATLRASTKKFAVMQAKFDAVVSEFIQKHPDVDGEKGEEKK